MNLALIGYGRMGHEVERIAHEHGMKVVRTFDSENIRSLRLNAETLGDVDVCIDFSTPRVVLENIDAVVRAGRSMVVGTTGWYDHLESVRKLVEQHNTGLVYSPNFSLGMNLFMHIVSDGARLLDRYPEYDVAISETHHATKADSPSGTALVIGSLVVQAMRRKQELITGQPHDAIAPNQVHISSLRVGHVQGKHSVVFDSETDSIELVHSAKNRSGFARGALVAAEWINGKRGVFTMRDVILQ
jgi:4-hydroxy-tetrahydrodipicolinate reductase